MFKRLLVLIIFQMIPFFSFGETLYVAVSGEKALSEMDPAKRVNLTGLENGLMDFLFDSGHIFFNSYKAGEEDHLDELIDDAILFAAEKRTPYVLFIRFHAYEENINYQLYDIKDMTSLKSGSFQIDEKSGLSYYNAGQTVGREIFAF